MGNATPEDYKARATYPAISQLERDELEKLAVEVTGAYADAHAKWLSAEDANAAYVKANDELSVKFNDEQAAHAELKDKYDKLSAYATQLEKQVAERETVELLVDTAKFPPAPADDKDSLGLPKVPGL